MSGGLVFHPEGIGTLGMIINFTVSMVVCHVTEAPPKSVQDMVEDIRIPRSGGTVSEPVEEGDTVRA